MFLSSVILIVLGLLAASTIIAAKVKDSDKVIAFLSQFQGYIGVVAFIWGVWDVIQAVLAIGWIGTIPVTWITWLAVGALELILGFIFGFGLISQYALSSNEEAKAKAGELLAKLTPVKATIGLIGIGVGIWGLVINFTGLIL